MTLGCCVVVSPFSSFRVLLLDMCVGVRGWYREGLGEWLVELLVFDLHVYPLWFACRSCFHVWCGVVVCWFEVQVIVNNLMKVK